MNIEKYLRVVQDIQTECFGKLQISVTTSLNTDWHSISITVYEYDHLKKLKANQDYDLGMFNIYTFFDESENDKALADFKAYVNQQLELYNNNHNG